MTTPEKDNVEGADIPQGSEAAAAASPAPDQKAAPSINFDDDAQAEEAKAAEVDLEPNLKAEVEEALEGAQSESEVVAKAKAEVAEWQDKYMRLHAEWDTYRRRTNEQRAAEKVRAAEGLMESLLPVLDDFQRTVDYAETNGEEGLLGGVKAVQAKLNDVLAKDGLQVINPQGEAFDALEAQAVGTVDDPSVPDETVAQVYQLGYRMGDKVLRPAMVVIAQGGPKREVPQEDE